MKNLLIIFTLLFVFPLFFLATTPAKAVTQNSNGELKSKVEELKLQNSLNRQTVKEQLAENKVLREKLRTELKTQITQKRATREAQLTENRKLRIRTFYNTLAKRLNAAIGRLERLTDRIESRVAKIKENNEDLDLKKVEADLLAAKSLLANAEAELNAATENLDTVLESNNPKEAFEIIKSVIQGVRKDLVDVHRLLVKLIGDIKGLRVGQNDLNGNPEDVATPTPTVTPTFTPTLTITPTLTPTIEPTVTGTI